MVARRPFKKDLTPIGPGGITKHVGKGATEQRRLPGGGETLTGGNPFASAGSQYPKPIPTPPPVAAPDVGAAPPMGPAPSSMPTALMPPNDVEG
jgi:hypothetical protein